MGDRIHEFGGATVVLVMFSEHQEVERYRRRTDLPYEILMDPDRSAYRAFGLGRGSVGRVWGWRAAERYVELIRRDGVRRLRRPVEDSLQLGGDFVIGPSGTLEYAYRSEGPEDRPSVEELLAALPNEN